MIWCRRASISHPSLVYIMFDTDIGYCHGCGERQCGQDAYQSLDIGFPIDTQVNP